MAPSQGNCFTFACGIGMLLSPTVWLEAATQIFFSLGLAQGALISLSTYTKDKIKAVRQSALICIVNSITSLVVAVVVYSVLGFQATQEGADLQQVTFRTYVMCFDIVHIHMYVPYYVRMYAHV